MKLFAELQNKEDPLNMEFNRTKLKKMLPGKCLLLHNLRQIRVTKQYKQIQIKKKK